MPGSRAPCFACDAMLGGLARWLRAAGYDASWHDGIADPELVQLSHVEGRTVLSSDGDVFEFALVRDGIVPALFVPRGLTVQAQLAYVLRELDLPLQELRCMACGGELVEMTREKASGRVPPRVLAYHGCFWGCVRCNKVFWHGTHWAKIKERLQQATSGTEGPLLGLPDADSDAVVAGSDRPDGGDLASGPEVVRADSDARRPAGAVAGSGPDQSDGASRHERETSSREPGKQRQTSLDRTIDSIRQQLGRGAVKRGSLQGCEETEKNALK